MKITYRFHKYILLGAAVALINTSCDDYLDITPPSQVSPADYLNDESHLAAYTIMYYADYSGGNYNGNDDERGGMFASHRGSGGQSPYWDDTHTDNQTDKGGNSRYLVNGMSGEWQVGNTGGKWNFKNIYRWNFYLNTVVPRQEKGEISGTRSYIDHYIGEGYYLRAQEYFYRLRRLGDFPIVKEVLPDDQEVLTEASIRQPRNEVARFILEDLDNAIALLGETAPGDNKRNRINKNVALLLKGRVALFEATWLKYHKGTPMVPNGPGWPGADKEATKNYQFPSGSIDGEIDFFLTQAMDASKKVAGSISLTTSTGGDPVGNPYYDIFAGTDLSGYNEVLMWRDTSTELAIMHSFNHWAYGGNTNGFTKQFEQSFLMQNGLPVYAAGSGYQGDNYIVDTKINRDNRWQLFMKAPGEQRWLSSSDTFLELPNVYDSGRSASSTGYIHGKGYSLNADNEKLGQDLTACAMFRAAEAYLIYIEACYEKNGSLDSDAGNYWQALRRRAGVDTDYMKTIAATDMQQEAVNDWGAYSKGEIVDATLYNIRRERRSELIGEGFRYDDLIRWRSMDQLNGFVVEGFRVATVFDQYDEDFKGLVNYDPAVSPYVRPNKNGDYANGYFFVEAHYLDPIAVKHFQITSISGSGVDDSPIYQNPGWPIEAGAGNLR